MNIRRLSNIILFIFLADKQYNFIRRVEKIGKNRHVMHTCQLNRHIDNLLVASIGFIYHKSLIYK